VNPSLSFDAQSPVLTTVRTRPLFVMRLDVAKPMVVGDTPNSVRRVGVVLSGAFEGERLSGVVLEGGSDWQSVRRDGATLLDVRLVLQASDGDRITMRYQGVRHGPAEVIARLESGEAVDPASYYFRITPQFEAPAGRHEWLNRIVAVGIGQRLASGPVYSVFELL
jgi:hypothetical protein